MSEPTLEEYCPECGSDDCICDEIILRAKWSIDGAKTLDETVIKLNEFIEYIRGLQREGYELSDEICDDYGFLRKP